MISNERIRNEHLSVIETSIPSGLAIAQIMRQAGRISSLWDEDAYETATNGQMVIETFGQSLRITYQGYEHYDLVLEVEELVRNTVNEDRRYVANLVNGRAFRSPHTAADEARLTIGLGDRNICWGTTIEGSDADALVPTSDTPLRKNTKEYRFEPSLRYLTTNAEFRKTLNKCKGGTFCIITRENKIGIFANTEDAPDVLPLASDGQEFADAIAGVDFKTIYYSLYRRKQSDLGLMNRLSSIGDFDITEFGIVDNRVYVRISGEGITATIMYHAVSGIPEVEIPASTLKRRRRRRAQEVIPDPVHVREDTLIEISESEEVVWTTEEEDRLILWQDAHAMWCENRNQERSNSRAVWFSHYSMALIRNGEAPDELDLEIMSKV